MATRARKRRRKKSDQTTQTISNMATSLAENVNNTSSPDLSQILNETHETLYNTNDNNPQPMFIQQQIQSTPLGPQGNAIIQPSQPNPDMNVSAHANQQTLHVPNGNDNTLQVILNTMHNMNVRLNKLNMLDQLCERMSAIEGHFQKLNTEIKDIRNDLKQQSDRISNEEFHASQLESRLTGIEYEKENLLSQNKDLKEKLLEMQTHSMKYNLIFSGVKENSSETENTEEVVKKVIKDELDIETDSMQFCNVHRLKPRSDGKPRSIIAKFVKYSDHEAVRSKAIEKLKDRKDIAIYQQFPAEVNTRRKELVPKLIELRKQGYKNARLATDKLYIGSELVDPSKVVISDNNYSSKFGPGMGPGFGPQYNPPSQSWGPPPRPMEPQFRVSTPSSWQHPRGPPITNPQSVRPAPPTYDQRHRGPNPQFHGPPVRPTQTTLQS